MKNKTCANCKTVNGERATYCRKCGTSLDDAVISEVVAKQKTVQRSRTTQSLSSRNNSARPGGARLTTTTKALPKGSGEKVVIPKRPAKPAVVYWPFVLSLVSAMVMLGLIVAFFISALKGDSSAPSTTSAAASTTGASATTAVASAESSEAATDLSEIIIGDIADQTYTGNEITIPFELTHNDHELVEGVDYTITYENNLCVGTATVYFEGIGDDFTGAFDTSFNIVSGDPVVDDPDNYVLTIFVMRMYWTMVGRSPSIDELITQTNRLYDGEITGSEYINEITFCDEAEQRNLNDEEFVSAFYQGALGRPADQAGLDYNVALLADGMSREDLVNGIINAPGGEFETICDSIGIAAS